MFNNLRGTGPTGPSAPRGFSGFNRTNNFGGQSAGGNAGQVAPPMNFGGLPQASTLSTGQPPQPIAGPQQFPGGFQLNAPGSPPGRSSFDRGITQDIMQRFPEQLQQFRSQFSGLPQFQPQPQFSGAPAPAPRPATPPNPFTIA